MENTTFEERRADRQRRIEEARAKEEKKEALMEKIYGIGVIIMIIFIIWLYLEYGWYFV